jgi:RNA recognition motif-containing protein
VCRHASYVFKLDDQRSCARNDGRLSVSNIYVGNLPFSATEEAVRALFAQHGTVDSVALMTDRETGRARGFGFVEMPRLDAIRAIQNLNGQDMAGRWLKVIAAQENQAPARSVAGR